MEFSLPSVAYHRVTLTIPLCLVRNVEGRKQRSRGDRSSKDRQQGRRDRMVIYKIKSLEYFSRTNPTPGGVGQGGRRSGNRKNSTGSGCIGNPRN